METAALAFTRSRGLLLAAHWFHININAPSYSYHHNKAIDFLERWIEGFVLYGTDIHELMETGLKQEIVHLGTWYLC